MSSNPPAPVLALQWMIDDCKKGRSAAPKKPRAEVAREIVIDREAAKVRFIHYLKHDAPLAIEGQGGDQTTFVVAAKGKDCGLSEAETYTLMSEHWNPRCSPPWDDDELATKVRNAYDYGQNEPGCDAPERVFAKQQTALKQLQDENSVLIVGGDTRILWDTHDAKGRQTHEQLSISSFKMKHAAKKAVIGKKEIPLTSLFLEHEGTTRYDGLEFDPQQGPEIVTEINGHRKSYFNLWRGFAYAPSASGSSHPSVDQLREHIDLNVCGGNETLSRWLFGYFAHLVQRPWEKPGVAVVLSGGKGCGKTFLIQRIGQLLGRHFLLASNRRYLVGNFNSHLENCLMLALDEAFWCGDRQVDGILKDLITGDTHVIERKGFEPSTVANKTRIVIISNEDEIVKATADERRYAMFAVGNRRRQDTAFFGAVQQGLERGGYPVLLRALLDFDLSGLDFNTAPKTQALLEQKITALEPWMQFWHECLVTGHIVESGIDGWPESISCRLFQRAVKAALDSRNIRGWLPTGVTIGKKMRPLGLKWRQQRVPQDKRLQGDPEVITTYSIPPLSEARQLFDDHNGQPIEWPER